MKDIVFDIIEKMLCNSPEASYKRLNPALWSTLQNCIEADLPFQPDTFSQIYNQLRGGYWFGDGAGSAMGEHFYTTSCSVNHASAQQSFERYAGRPGVLWEENAAQPNRLCVGSRFTWKGHFVEVTSMRADSLVAVTRKSAMREACGIAPGATFGYHPKYTILSSKREGAHAVLRVIKSKNPAGDNDIVRRFTIKYAEIVELRRSAKKRLNLMLGKIIGCDPSKDANRLTKEINAEHFRHFELEEIQKAFAKRKEWLAAQDQISAWRAGTNGAWLNVKSVMLGVREDRVECSTGNGVSLVAARKVFPVLLEHRKKSTALSLPLDSYQIERVGSAGVKIGCTVVPWSEIDLISPQLQS